MEEESLFALKLSLWVKNITLVDSTRQSKQRKLMIKKQESYMVNSIGMDKIRAAMIVYLMMKSAEKC